MASKRTRECRCGCVVGELELELLVACSGRKVRSGIAAEAAEEEEESVFSSGGDEKEVEGW